MTDFASFSARFPWGLLVVTDHLATEEVPEWSEPDQMVTSCATGLVARVQHEQEGPVTVRVASEPPPSGDKEYFSGVIDTASGILRVSDALQEHASFTIDVPERVHVSIYADDSTNATRVNAIIRVLGRDGTPAASSAAHPRDADGVADTALTA